MKRDLWLADDSGVSIQLTIWGDEKARSTDFKENAVIAVKGVRVGDFGGKSLSTSSNSIIDFNPDIREAHSLRGWWDPSKADGLRSLTERAGGMGGGGGAGAGGEGPLSLVELRKALMDIKSLPDLHSDNPGVHVVKASLFSSRNDDPNKIWYAACNAVKDNGRMCQKKCVLHGGMWSCADGCLLPTGQPSYRYILSGTLVDASGQEYATFFDGEAAQLLGKTAPELHADLTSSGLAREDGTIDASSLPGEYHAFFKRSLFREYLLTVKAKMEAGRDGGENRLRTTVVKVREVDAAKESKALIAGLKKYLGAMGPEAVFD